ncbi:uncharacterized protein BX664DRAFT_329775 [Halteromyces radiatus]|uniref:uncharacterized protein n=1 Tax=Halteromyces radiatus TaxID=101107 RepID=UPI0022206F74|nr:uncharacterized protein BX664DRAFT_329775 [Halteromyces radiatus]KAI8093464.1 hypothetical protein BX664DRAFT_329775 [Halteromyces radiatus]
MFMRHINEVKIAMSPFNSLSKSSRLLLSRVNTNEAKKANPTIKIVTTVLNDPKAPSQVDIVYRDGNKLSVKADQMNIDTLMQTVNKHAKKLEEIDQANSW